MRAVVQRVSRANVIVGGQSVGTIQKGLLVLLAVGAEDDESDALSLAKKVLNLRIFEDPEGKMNLSVQEADGRLLAVSQFTLYGDCRRGNRPSFASAAPPDQAQILYEHFLDHLRSSGVPVACGKFQTRMDVELVNDGPVTILLDSKKRF